MVRRNHRPIEMKNEKEERNRNFNHRLSGAHAPPSRSQVSITDPVSTSRKKITQADDELNEPSSTLIPGPVPGDEFESPAPLIACISSGSSQLSSTVALTLLTYSFIFSRYNCAASAFAGLFGLGSWSRLCMLVKIAATSYVGDHLFCKMSRQSSPFAYTFGWNILDRNLTEGGLFG